MLKRLDKFIGSINFKKVTKVYVLVSLLLLVLAIASTAYVFRDKISFAFNYLRIDSRVDGNGIDDSIRDKLNVLAGSAADIKDVLLLDKDNNIVYSSKNSGLSKNNKLVLSKVKDKRNLLQDANSPKTYYKVVKPEELLLTKDLLRSSKDIKKEYTDDFFYNADFNARKVYFLNYFADRRNGMKIFVISDIKPVPYAEPMVESMAAVLMLILGFYWILTALWVYRDANKRKLNAALWGLLILLTNLVGVIVYAIYKQNNQTCFKCDSLQNKQNIFCSCCGTRINESCSKCGTIVSKSDQYCTGCGAELNR